MTKAAEGLRKEALTYWFEKAFVGHDRRAIKDMAPYVIGVAETAFEAGWDAGAVISAIEVAAIRMTLRDCATALHADRAHSGEFKDCDMFGCYSALQRLG